MGQPRWELPQALIGRVMLGLRAVPGVASYIQSISGSIGYVELSYAVQK